MLLPLGLKLTTLGCVSSEAFLYCKDSCRDNGREDPESGWKGSSAVCVVNLIKAADN